MLNNFWIGKPLSSFYASKNRIRPIVKHERYNDMHVLHNFLGVFKIQQQIIWDNSSLHLFLRKSSMDKPNGPKISSATYMAVGSSTTQSQQVKTWLGFSHFTWRTLLCGHWSNRVLSFDESNIAQQLPFKITRNVIKSSFFCSKKHQVAVDSDEMSQMFKEREEGLKRCHHEEIEEWQERVNKLQGWCLQYTLITRSRFFAKQFQFRGTKFTTTIMHTVNICL